MLVVRDEQSAKLRSVRSINALKVPQKIEREKERVNKRKREWVNNGYCFRNHTVCNRANKIGKRRTHERKRADRVGEKKIGRRWKTIPTMRPALNWEYSTPPPRCRFDTANGRAVSTVSRKPFLSFTIIHNVYRGAYIRRLVKRFSTSGSAKMLLRFFAITNSNIISRGR